MTNGIEERIAALLAKAEGTDNEHERDAFNKKAEALMIKAGVDEATAREAGRRKGQKAKAEIIRQPVEMKGRYGRALISLGFSVVRSLGGLKAYKTQKHNSEEGWLFIVGFEPDVRRAIRLIESLKFQADVAAKRWWKDAPERLYATPREGWKARRNFITYFGLGVEKRIAEVYKTVIAEEKGPGTELALVSRDKQVETWLADRVKLRAGRGHQVGHSGRGAGYTAGTKADVGGRAIGR